MTVGLAPAVAPAAPVAAPPPSTPRAAARAPISFAWLTPQLKVLLVRITAALDVLYPPLPPAIWTITIPDPILSACLHDLLGVPGDRLLTNYDAVKLTDLTCFNSNNLTGLEDFTNLETLYLGQGGITDLRPLAHLTKLTSAILGTNTITDVSPLAGLTRLTSLHLNNNRISDVAPLGRLTGLTQLYLSKNQISDVSALSSLTNLTYLSLDRNNVSQAKPLARLTNLDYLFLGNNSVSDTAVFGPLTKLKILDLTNNHIGEYVPAAGLANLTKLDFLILRDNDIPDALWITPMTGLTRLDLSGNDLVSTSGLGSLTNLVDLQLSSNPLTDISALASLKKLPALDLSHTRVSDLTPLAGLTGLTFLGLQPARVTDLTPVPETIPVVYGFGQAVTAPTTLAGAAVRCPVRGPGGVCVAPPDLVFASGPATPVLDAAAGTITYPVAGTYTIKWNTSPKSQWSFSGTLTQPVNATLAITTTTLADATVGQAARYLLSATGGGSRVWSLVSGSTDGLTLSAGGVLSGTPVAPGTFTFTVKVADSLSSDTKTLKLTVLGAPVVGGPVQPVVVGNHLTDSRTGAVWTPHGANWPGLEYACSDWGGWTPPLASMTEAAAWGIDLARIPLNQDCWLGADQLPSAGYGYPGTPAATPAQRAAQYQAQVKAWVSAAHAAGLAVILDLHRTAPTGTPAQTDQWPMADDQSAAFWSSVAGAYKDDPSVMFELFNEPYSRAAPAPAQQLTWQCWRDGGCLLPNVHQNAALPANLNAPGATFPVTGMAALVNAVRQAGAKQPALLGGLNYANDLTGWLQYKPNDSQLVAAWHNYAGQGYSSPAQWDDAIAKVAAQVPVLMTEVGYEPSNTGYLEQAMAWADTKGIGYLPWAWWDGNETYDDYSQSCQAYSLFAGAAYAPSTEGAVYQQHLATLKGQVPPAAMTVTTAALPAVTVGQGLCFQLTATGPAPYVWSLTSGSLGGLKLTSDGFLCGQPKTAGAYPITVKVTGATGLTATKSWTLTVR